MDYTIFGQVDISRQRELLSGFYEIMASFNEAQFAQAVGDEFFGSNPDYNSLVDFHYLFMLLMTIDDNMKNDLVNGNTAPWYDKRYYIDKYQLDCVRAYFKCKGFDITPLLALIELDSTERPGGIGYMYIEGNPDDINAETFVVS